MAPAVMYIYVFLLLWWINGDYSFQQICLFTGVAIEISLAKDRSLSVVITGKEEAVKVARKLVLQQLQTQVATDVSSFGTQ